MYCSWIRNGFCCEFWMSARFHYVVQWSMWHCATLSPDPLAYLCQYDILKGMCLSRRTSKNCQDLYCFYWSFFLTGFPSLLPYVLYAYYAPFLHRLELSPLHIWSRSRSGKLPPLFKRNMIFLFNRWLFHVHPLRNKITIHQESFGWRICICGLCIE